METTRIIFLRHAETEKDPSINAAMWGLSEKGEHDATEVSLMPVMNSVDVIYVSEERKTLLTIEPLLKKLGKSTQALSCFNEVRRGDKFLTKEDFEAEKEKQLLDLSFPAFGGETGLEALRRFKEGVEQVATANKGRTVLVVSHGTILNIYFADLLGAYGELPERWGKTSFCAIGIVEDGKVIQDIVSLG